MRPFVSRFILLFGLLLILTGILLIVENKTTLAWVLIPVGIITFIIASFNVLKKEPEHEAGVFIEPDAEEFESEEDKEPSNQEK